MRPDAMLLDEPSNHLDLESLIWLEQFLKDYQGALLMTSHDREFMNRIVTKIVEIDGGALTTYSGDYEFYEQQRALGEQNSSSPSSSVSRRCSPTVITDKSKLAKAIHEKADAGSRGTDNLRQSFLCDVRNKGGPRPVVQIRPSARESSPVAFRRS